MKNTLSFVVAAYRQYRAISNKSKVYRAIRYSLLSLTAVYVLLLSYPQILFAHEVSYNHFKVYSREPLDQNIYAMLDKVELKLSASPINSNEVKPKIFLTNSHKLYALLSLYIGGNSFGKGFPLLPTQNVFINKADVSKDLVFRDAPAFNQRSLSAVVSHEVTHLLIRQKFGYVTNLTAPAWKKEGYSEYVSGGSTLDHETGVRMWKASPDNDRGYQYFKYYTLVKYLLEHDKMTVEQLFDQNIDQAALESRVLATL